MNKYILTAACGLAFSAVGVSVGGCRIITPDVEEKRLS